MVYRGRIEKGVAVLEGDARLPDGTVVEVVPVEPPAVPEKVDPVYRLYELAMPSGIPDLAENIDHYLYGHPKASDEQE
ncbi:MAG: hypothetical protein JW959_01510 [Pirellulales bacterium]|nr:hypothetical protein [Pirellulales bacterium]